KNAALTRRHGRKLIRRSGLADLVGSNPRRQPKLLKPRLAVSHAIETDLFVLVAGEMKHLHGKQFKGTQQLATAFEQELRIGPGKFHQNLRALPVAVFADRRIDRDAVFKLETGVLDDRAEERV